MKYKLSFNTVFDTQTKRYSKVEDGFDEDAVGKYIIFNIYMQGNAKACDFADANKFNENKSFAKVTAFLDSKKVPYVIDPDTDFSSIKKVKVTKKAAERTSTAIKKEKDAVKKETSKSPKYDVEDVSIDADEEAMERQFQSNIDEMRTIDTSGLMTENDILSEEKLNEFRDRHIMKAMKIVKDRFPAYYLMLSTLDKKYVVGEEGKSICSTLGVTSACELIINVDFAMRLSVPQLVFILCHEAGHIALKHISRCMAFGQIPDINNIAGDLIINKMLAEDLDAKPGEANDIVAFPNLGLYDPNLDLANTTLESLYALIAGEMEKIKEMQEVYTLYEDILKKRFELAVLSAMLKSQGNEKLVEVVEKQVKDVDTFLSSVKV